MKPCLVVRVFGGYRGYSERGRLVVFDPKSWDAVTMECRDSGREIVSPNSRVGRTIFDRLPKSIQEAVAALPWDHGG